MKDYVMKFISFHYLPLFNDSHMSMYLQQIGQVAGAAHRMCRQKGKQKRTHSHKITNNPRDDLEINHA